MALGAGGSAAAVKAGEAFVQVSARDDKLREGLKRAQGNLSQFGQTAGKIGSTLGALAPNLKGFGEVADAASAGVGALKAAGIGLAAVGAIEFGKYIGGLKDFQKAYAVTVQQVMDGQRRLRSELENAINLAPVSGDPEAADRILSIARADLNETRKEVERLTAASKKAAAEQTAAGRIFKGAVGIPTELEHTNSLLETQTGLLKESQAAYDAVAKAIKGQQDALEAAYARTRQDEQAAIDARKASLADLVKAEQMAIDTHGMDADSKRLAELRAVRDRTGEELEQIHQLELLIEKRQALDVDAETQRILDGVMSAAETTPKFGSSAGAFQASNFRQVLGGSGIDKQQLGELSKANKALVEIAKNTRKGGTYK